MSVKRKATVEGSFSSPPGWGVLGPGHWELGAGRCRVPGQAPDTGQGSLFPDLGDLPGQQVRREGTGPPSLAIPAGGPPRRGAEGAAAWGWLVCSLGVSGRSTALPGKERTGRRKNPRACGGGHPLCYRSPPSLSLSPPDSGPWSRGALSRALCPTSHPVPAARGGWGPLVILSTHQHPALSSTGYPLPERGWREPRVPSTQGTQPFHRHPVGGLGQVHCREGVQ